MSAPRHPFPGLNPFFPPLALQPLVDECYRVGSYWLSDDARDLQPPLPAEDMAWVHERLQAAGLR